jgi:hypothetical protein
VNPPPGAGFGATDLQVDDGALSDLGTWGLVGSLNGYPDGTLATRYEFEAKIDPAGTEIRGRCPPPIVAGGGIRAGNIKVQQPSTGTEHNGGSGA